MIHGTAFLRWVGAGLGAVSALAALNATPARAEDGKSAYHGARFLIEGMILWRSDYEGGVFTDTAPGAAQGVKTEAGDFDPDETGGLRMIGEIPASVLGGLLPQGYALQFGAMYAKGFEGDIFLDDPNEDTSTTYSSDLGGIVSPGLNDNDARDIRNMTADIETTIAGSELNALTPAGSVLGGRAFFGTRFIYFSEQLDAIVFDSGLAGVDNHLISIEVDNNLYGVQAGWEGYFPVSGNISIGGRFAGGLFYNRVERERSLVDQDTAGNALADEISEGEFSQMLEANPRILIGLGDGIALTLGGTVLWLNDVSVASSHWSNLLNRDDKDTRADDDVLIYGATAGVTIFFN